MEWNFNDGLKALTHMKMRYSCRSFEDKPIPEELLRNILETGLAAASGGNIQPVSMVVISDKEINNEIFNMYRQPFIKMAAINIVFLLDLHRMSILAKHEKAPYTCNDSYMHYLIGIEDVMCTAQTIETAVHLCGLGSCYVGSVNHGAPKLVELLNLNEMTFPVLMLSIGYPKDSPTIAPKLNFDMMVHMNKYRKQSDEEILEGYREKYGSTEVPLPTEEPMRGEALERFKRALRTTYSEEESEAITRKADENGFINRTQRQFGLHYNAHDMRKGGEEIIKDLENQKITPFYRKS